MCLDRFLQIGYLVDVNSRIMNSRGDKAVSYVRMLSLM